MFECVPQIVQEGKIKYRSSLGHLCQNKGIREKWIPGLFLIWDGIFYNLGILIYAYISVYSYFCTVLFGNEQESLGELLQKFTDGLSGVHFLSLTVFTFPLRDVLIS